MGHRKQQQPHSTSALPPQLAAVKQCCRWCANESGHAIDRGSTGAAHFIG
jgi:hypothetical protein